MRNITGKKCIFLLVILCIALLCGCQSRSEPELPDQSELAAITSGIEYEKTLIAGSRPEYVALPEWSDPSLYTPLCFASQKELSDLTVLIRNEYFTYDLMETQDFDALNLVTDYTNVNVICFDDETRTSWRSRYSCFIYRIEEDYIYLGTAGHCVDNRAIQANTNLMFFDRKVIQTPLSDYILFSNFGNSEGDYGMIRVPTSEVPRDTLLKLKQVCYNADACSAVKRGDYVFTGNINAQNNRTDYDKTIQVSDESEEPLTSVSNRWNWINSRGYILGKGSLQSGQSGSGVFNYKGELVGICSGVGDWYGSVYCLVTRANKMEEIYMKLKGE